MKPFTAALLAASLLLNGGCAFDVLSTEPEVDIPPERAKDPVYPPKDGDETPDKTDPQDSETN